MYSCILQVVHLPQVVAERMPLTRYPLQVRTHMTCLMPCTRSFTGESLTCSACCHAPHSLSSAAHYIMPLQHQHWQVYEVQPSHSKGGSSASPSPGCPAAGRLLAALRSVMAPPPAAAREKASSMALRARPIWRLLCASLCAARACQRDSSNNARQRLKKMVSPCCFKCHYSQAAPDQLRYKPQTTAPHTS